MDAIYTISKDFKGRFKVVCELTSGQGNVFVGQAICSLEDTFNPDLGMTLARIRAEMKQMRRITKNRQKVTEEAEQVYRHAGKAWDKALEREYALLRQEHYLMHKNG